MRLNISKRLVFLLALMTMLALPPLVNAQTQPKLKTSSRRTTKKPLVPVGTNLKMRLEDTLSSKNSRVGDRFSMTVLDPVRFNEATVTGHISSIKKSGKVKGTTSINLAFDRIRLSDGRSGTVHGYVTKVYGSGSGQADNEGSIESGGRGKQTVKRTAIGAGAGGVLGAIIGGGKGAAIGLILGGAGGAGSLAVKGSKELKLESGTEMLVRVTR